MPNPRHEFIIGKLQHMAQSDILAMVGESELARIKAIDPNPIIQVYGIGHEGKSDANLIGMGHKQFEFLRSAVKAMYDKITTGTKAFFGHGKESNSHDGRIEVGEIVGKSIEEREGGLFNKVAVWVKEKTLADTLDIASIEQEVMYESTPDGVKVHDINEVTGVALGNSATDRPGFPGATLIASMQAFAKEQETMPMTADEIRKAINDAGLKPGDIFSKTVLKQDDVVRDLTYEHSQKEFDHRKQVEAQLEEAKKKLEAVDGVDIPALKAKAAKADKLDAAQHLEKVCKDAKLNDKQAAFVRKRFDKTFTPDGATDLEKATADHVKQLIDEYRENAEFYGVKLDADPGTPSGDDDSKGGAITDYSDPAQNPAIPTD